MKGKKALLLEKQCPECQKIFTYKNTKKNKNRKFCSLHCSVVNNGKANKGRKMSPEFVEACKLRVGDKNPFFGKTHSKKSIAQAQDKLHKIYLNKVKHCHLSDKEMEILDGLMISDGCMSSTTGISARFTCGFKYESLLHEIKKVFPSFEFGNIIQNKKTKCFHMKSRMYSEFLDENRRWYVDGKKIIPKDFRFTSTSCFWWFISDGYLNHNNVYLCTMCFNDEDLSFIMEEFKKLDFKVNLTGSKCVSFSKESSEKFINWILESNYPLDDYTYKLKQFA